MKCKPGYHYVQQHFRISKNGIKHVVDAHCRKNPKHKKNFLFASNLNYIFYHESNKFKYHRLNKIKGYSDNGQYDKLIQFWLQHWESKGLIKDKIDPLLIKAIIAVESSFREKIITSMPNSSATGLMQVTKATMAILSKKKSAEVKTCNIEITQSEAQDANINIAIGTRWIIYKITTSPCRKKKSKDERIKGGIKYYHSWDKEGDDYLEKVLRIYNACK